MFVCWLKIINLGFVLSVPSKCKDLDVFHSDTEIGCRLLSVLSVHCHFSRVKLGNFVINDCKLGLLLFFHRNEKIKHVRCSKTVKLIVLCGLSRICKIK
jgi:hypothetical protein